MGYDLHITRADHWVESEGQPISSEAWNVLLASDPELVVSLDTSYDREVAAARSERTSAALWIAHQDRVPFWFQDGEITTKNPDDMGDDGEIYSRDEAPPGCQVTVN